MSQVWFSNVTAGNDTTVRKTTTHTARQVITGAGVTCCPANCLGQVRVRLYSLERALAVLEWGGLWMRCGEQGWRQRWQLLRLRVDAAECAAGTEIVVLPVRQYGRRRVGNLAAEDHLGNILICTARLAFGDPKLKSKPDRYIV